MPSRIYFGNSIATPTNISLEPVVVEVAAPGGSIAYDQLIALAPVVVELTLPAITLESPLEITLAPVVINVSLPAGVIENPREITIGPLAVQVRKPAMAITQQTTGAITPGGGSESGGTVAFLDVYRPDGTLVIAAMPYVISYKLRRELNAIGSWTIQIPVSEPIVETYALSRLITRGWTINLSVDGVHPKQRLDYDYLVYRGVVELKSYAIDESGAAICELSGANRATVLSERITPTSADYVQETMQAVAEDIEDGLAGGITFPANASRPISIRFNNDDGDGIISLYSRLIKLGEQARWALRERWGEDDLEFIALDGAPDAGYRMIASEYWRAGHPQAAIVAGTPELRRDGSGMITRIIPFGVDTITEFDTEAEVNMNLAETRYGITPTSPALLTFGTQPTVGKVMNLGGTTYTFVETASAPGDIEVGATLFDTQTNIVAAVNGTDGVNTVNARSRLHPFSGNDARISYGNEASSVDDIMVVGSFTDDSGNTSTTGDMSSASRTVEIPLTLEHAPGSFPYEVKTGTNPDGSNYWYLEDEDAIADYGLIEMALTRSDIKNPNDDSVSRAKAANVLYQFAWSQLTRGKSPKVFFSADIANGQEVWALPGDRMHVQYSGLVSIGGGVVVWEDVDAWMLVTTREEESTESGARAVKLTLTAPEVPFEITGLPEAMGLPGATGGGEDGPGDDGDGEDEGTGEDGGDDSGDGVSFPPPDPWIPPDLYPPGVPPGVVPGDYGSLFPDCCPDPTTTTTDIGDPIEGPPAGPGDASTSITYQVYNADGGVFAGTQSPISVDTSGVAAAIAASNPEDSGIIFVAIASQGAYDGSADDGPGVLVGYNDAFALEPFIDGFTVLATERFRSYWDGWYSVIPPYTEHPWTEDEARLTVLSKAFGPGEIPDSIDIDFAEDAGVNLMIYVVALPLADTDIDVESFYVNRPSVSSGTVSISPPSTGRRLVVFSVGNAFKDVRGDFESIFVETINSITGATQIAEVAGPFQGGGYLSTLRMHIGEVDGGAVAITLNERPSNAVEPNLTPFDPGYEPPYPQLHGPLWVYDLTLGWTLVYPNMGPYLAAAAIAVEIAPEAS